MQASKETLLQASYGFTLSVNRAVYNKNIKKNETKNKHWFPKPGTFTQKITLSFYHSVQFHLPSPILHLSCKSSVFLYSRLLKRLLRLVPILPLDGVKATPL